MAPEVNEAAFSKVTVPGPLTVLQVVATACVAPGSLSDTVPWSVNTEVTVTAVLGPGFTVNVGVVPPPEPPLPPDPPDVPPPCVPPTADKSVRSSNFSISSIRDVPGRSRRSAPERAARLRRTTVRSPARRTEGRIDSSHDVIRILQHSGKQRP